MKFSKYNIFIYDDKNKRHLLNNSFTGATFVVEDDIKQIILEDRLEYLDDKHKKMFIDAGVIDKYDDQLDRIEYYHNKLKFSNNSLNITLLLTMNCNLRCIYCYEAAGIVSKEKLDKGKYDSLYKFIVNQLAEKRLNNLNICLFGGEPTLSLKQSRNFLSNIKKHCEENNIGYTTSIVTNGTLIDDEIIEILIENNCNSSQITVDGTMDFHDKRRIYADGSGSFSKTIDGIKKIKSSGLNYPVIRVNLDKTNVDNIYNLLDYLCEIGLNDCPLDFGIVKSNTPSCEDYEDNCLNDYDIPRVLNSLWQYAKAKNFNIYISPSRKMVFCGMFYDSSYTITPDLKVYKCWDLVNQEKHVAGMISEDGVFINEKKAFFKWMNRNPIKIGECVDCKYLPACGGGCAALRTENTNDYDKPGCYKIKNVYELEVLSVFEK